MAADPAGLSAGRTTRSNGSTVVQAALVDARSEASVLAMGNVLALLLAYQLVCAVIGLRVGRERGHPVIGAALGYVFGVFGLAALVLITPHPGRPSAF